MATYTTISPGEALILIAHNANVVIIDVRTRDEFSEAHIPGALNLPLYEMLELLESYVIPLSQPIVVHCQSGQRSKIAAQALAYVGYTNVYAVSGDLVEPFMLADELLYLCRQMTMHLIQDENNGMLRKIR